MLTIRRAAASDAAGVEAIYTPYVLGSYATFAFEPPTVDYWRHPIVDADRVLGHELLVAEDGGMLIGFGFRRVGTLSEVGHKLGVWRDLAYSERPIRSV